MTDDHYWLRDKDVDGSEFSRLDELHSGLRAYLEGALSRFDTEMKGMSPTRILDLGAGSGAWAIQAALEYPEATVLAADIKPMPARDLPKNLDFWLLDILNPGQLDQEKFDVVHVRMVFYHIPTRQIPRVLEFIGSSLLKQGGLLLVEDCGPHFGFTTPAMKTFDNIYLSMLKAKGLDPVIGMNISQYIADTQLYTDIESHKLTMTLTANPARCGPSPFARALLSTITRIVAGPIGEDMGKAGLTPELKEKWLEERNDPNVETTHDYWFVKARVRY